MYGSKKKEKRKKKKGCKEAIEHHTDIYVCIFDVGKCAGQLSLQQMNITDGKVLHDTDINTRR